MTTMTTMTTIHPKYLPMRSPLMPLLVLALVIDRFQLSQLIWGIYCAWAFLAVLFWIILRFQVQKFRAPTFREDAP